MKPPPLTEWHQLLLRFRERDYRRSTGEPPTRRIYAQLYYWRTVEKRRKLANEYKQRCRWSKWLIEEIRAMESECG